MQDQPFTPFMPEALFNISKFLMHELMTETDLPISKLYVYIYIKILAIYTSHHYSNKIMYIYSI